MVFAEPGTKLRGSGPPPNPFSSERYRTRAGPLAAMRPYEFVETEADRTYRSLIEWNREIEPFAIHCEYGDPARYPGLNAYEGVPRLIRRFVNHEEPSAYSQYAFRGDPLFVQQLALGSTRRDADYIPPPRHMLTLPTEGVALALRHLSEALFLAPGEDGQKDNVIAPMYTYLSHMAEVVRRNAEIRSCTLERDGQVNLKHMEELIDSNTRAVIIATVGNPLAIAIRHNTYEEMMFLLQGKMEEYKHPIWLVADVIYEPFRREENGPRLDAIQKSLSMGRHGVDVPTVEMSSFSKMFAMAGQRMGYLKALASACMSLEHSQFADERRDVLKAIEIVYDTTLCPVPSLLQKAMGKLYFSINNRLFCEEKLAPLVAALSAMENLTEQKGKGDSHTMMPEEVPEEIVRALGLDPSIWFTTSAIAKRTRKLAQNELSKYMVDIHTRKIERMGERLMEAGLIEECVLEVDREKMTDIFVAAVMKHGRIEHKLIAGHVKGEEKIGKPLTDAERRIVVDCQVSELLNIENGDAARIRTDMEGHEADFGLRKEDGNENRENRIRLVFYRLKEGVSIPQVARREDGQLELYKIAEKIFGKKVPGSERWEEIADACKIPRENLLYNAFKEKRRAEVFRRIDTFVNAIEEMRKRGLGVYLHPSYYDENGELRPERINSFYVLFGFDKLRGSFDQSSEFMVHCIANHEDIVKTTTGSIFLAPDVRELEDSYIRFVSLLDIGSEDGTLISESDMGRALKAIEVVAKSLGPLEPRSPGEPIPRGDPPG